MPANATDQPKHRLKELRLAADLTRRDLAREFDLTPKAIAEWELGDIPTKHLRRLAMRFGVSISYLLCDDGQEAA